MHQAEALQALMALPPRSVDAVITDPPSSSGGFTRSDRQRAPSAKYVTTGTKRVYPEFEGDSRDGRSWLLWCTLWLTECRRIVRPGGLGMVFSDWRQLPNAIDALQAGGFVHRGIVVWAKGADARPPHTGYFRPQAEYVAWGSAGHLDKAPGRGPWTGGVHARTDPREKLHMTGKPLSVMRHLVRAVPPGGVVVDTFAGSGTTVAACIRDGRLGVGFEVSPAYVAVANVRLNQEVEGIGANRLSVIDGSGAEQKLLVLLARTPSFHLYSAGPGPGGAEALGDGAQGSEPFREW